jgi:prepilin-type N-terminal cleavage/methylation domain-containing protein
MDILHSNFTHHRIKRSVQRFMADFRNSTRCVYHHPNTGGFTLIELIIVVAISSIVVVLAVSNFATSHYNLRGAANNVKFFLQTTRMRAINTNKQHRIAIDIDNNKLDIEIGDKRSGSTNWIATTESYTLPNEINVDHVTHSGGTANSGIINLVFDPDSTCSTGGIYIENDENDKYNITLTTATARPNLNEGW